jgi:exonuclease VII small subunit
MQGWNVPPVTAVPEGGAVVIAAALFFHNPTSTEYEMSNDDAKGFRASESDWEDVIRRSESPLGEWERTIRELRDRVKLLETGSYMLRNSVNAYTRRLGALEAVNRAEAYLLLRARTMQQPADAPSDEELWELRRERMEKACPGAKWPCHQEIRHPWDQAMITGNRALFDAGVAWATARAEQH